MNEFYSLQVIDVRKETDDCVSVAFQVGVELQEAFGYHAGQYLTLQANIDGELVRRSYSLCSSPSDSEWRVAIKQVEGGKFSTWANQSLNVGDKLDVMPPNGKFILEPIQDAARNFLAFAAGSGITPIMSQIRELMISEPNSQFTLFYVNRDTPSIIFREALSELKDRYLDRLRLFHILTREPQDIELLNGRLDEQRCKDLLKSGWIQIENYDAAFLCGPEEMIFACKAALESEGMPTANIRFELFTTSSSASSKSATTRSEEVSKGGSKMLSVVLDGLTTTVEVPDGRSIMDAALDAGLDAPYSCLGGVCCTCRAKMVQGQVEMDVNYALEPDETEAGFVLTCQSKLKGEGPFEVDFDQQ